MSESRRRSYLDPHLAEIISCRRIGETYTDIARRLYRAGLRTPVGYFRDEYHQVAAISGNARAIVERHFAERIYGHAVPKRSYAYSSGIWTPEREAAAIAQELGA